MEFTILLPLLLIMLSGLIEFGFLLNFYLDVIDGAREAARLAANKDPIRTDAGVLVDMHVEFYYDVQELTKQSLLASSDGRIDWPGRASSSDVQDCGPVNGDIVISAFGAVGNSVDKRFPQAIGDPGVSLCSKHFSNLTTFEINDLLDDPAYSQPVANTGFVLVEVYYEYAQTLGLPWIKAFVPDPVTLYAYSIMPNVFVEPTPIPP